MLKSSCTLSITLIWSYIIMLLFQCLYCILFNCYYLLLWPPFLFALSHPHPCPGFFLSLFPLAVSFCTFSLLLLCQYCLLYLKSKIMLLSKLYSSGGKYEISYNYLIYMFVDIKWISLLFSYNKIQ